MTVGIASGPVEIVKTGFAKLILAQQEGRSVTARCACSDTENFEGKGIPTGLRAVEFVNVMHLSINVGSITFWSTCDVEIESA